MNRKICIFGASGATGLVLTQLFLESEQDVVAFVRSETAQHKLPLGVITKVGSLLNRGEVECAITGCDVVVCAIGPRLSSPEAFCADATQNIIASMKAQGVRRLVCLTGAMVGDYPHLSWFMRIMRFSYQKQQPVLAIDRSDQEKCVEASGLDWTLVKPPRLTNGKRRGGVRSGEALKVGMMSSISRSDLGCFLLEQADSQEYIGKQVVVQY
jgi:putative NADH-flavin reductase